MLYQRFINPSRKYRAISFWALNGDLKAKELIRQLDYFQSMGLGGACLHARSGLQTPYLSSRWFKLMRLCVEHARRRGMIVWLYDEDRYPSGGAGGLVTQHAEFRQKRLRMEIGRTAENGKEILARFAVARAGDRFRSYRPIAQSGECERNEVAVSFSVREAPRNPWFNGYTYLDTMSVAAVQAFIESTYEPYRRAFHKEFGKTVEGIFTDEPGHGTTLGRWWGDFIDGYKEAERREIPWTPLLREKFHRQYGYDLAGRLPELIWDFADVPASLARYHYHALTTSLLKDSFCGTIGRWCDSKGIAFLGHVLSEETPSSQANVVGSAMRMYEHFRIPGVDILTAHCRDYDTVIQCASVANQMGRKWLLSETLGATGWNFSLQGHKSLTDWQIALGVNRRCLHLSFYTMAGAAKRDYPASISFQSAWSAHYKPVEDYFARVTSVLSEGKPIRPVLVVHPIESTWLRYRAGWNEAADVKQLDKNLAELRDWLLMESLGFDYADEEQLSRWGGVAKQSGKVEFAVRLARYSVVVVPPLLTIRSTTLGKLREFRARGGRVVWLGHPPRLVDAMESEEATNFAKSCDRVAFSRSAVGRSLVPAAEVRVHLHSRIPTVLHQLRREKDRNVLFICNTDETNATNSFAIDVAAQGYVEEWDTATGVRFAVDATKIGRFLRFKTELPPSGSRIFVTSRSRDRRAKPRPRYRDVRRKTLSGPEWEFRLGEPNPLVLDSVSVRIGNGPWTKPMEVLKADRWLRQELGWKPHSYFEVQPWKQPATSGKVHRVSTKAVFSIEGEPPKSIVLAAELIRGERSPSINGTKLDPTSATAGWVDPCFRQLSIDRSQLRKGDNEITLELDYSFRSGLEAAYILSDSAVRLNRRSSSLCEMGRTLKVGDVTRQGLPFYGASISYSRVVELGPRREERIFLRLGKWAGACAIVHLDGREVGKILWQPYEVELPNNVRGSHELTIEIILGRGNTFGPLHVRDWPVWWGPSEWETTGSRWQDAYKLSPSGLLGPPEIVYCKTLPG